MSCKVCMLRMVPRHTYHRKPLETPREMPMRRRLFHAIFMSYAKSLFYAKDLALEYM